MQILRDLSCRLHHVAECWHECNGYSFMESDPLAEVSSCFGHALIFITEFLTLADSEVSDDLTMGQWKKAMTRVMLSHA